MIIERRIAARGALQPVVEIEHDFVQRHSYSSITRPEPMYSNFFCTPRFSSSSARMPPMYSSRVITVASMIGSSICLISVGSGKRVGLSTSITSPWCCDAVAHAGRGGDQIDIELALQALLHDFQMQQAEEAAAEAEAQRDGIFRLEAEALSFSRSFSSASRSSPCSCDSTGYSPAKTIGLISSKPGSGSAPDCRVGDGVADLGVRHVLMLA
jgi:hypothetical protein